MNDSVFEFMPGVFWKVLAALTVLAAPSSRETLWQTLKSPHSRQRF